MKSDRSQANNNKHGSPAKGEPNFLIIGKIRRPHGVRGEVLFEVITDFPERIQPDLKVYIGAKKDKYVVQRVRTQPPHLLLKFKEINDRDIAGEFRNQLVSVRAVDLPELPEDEFYIHQLIGLRVVTQTREELGNVTEIIETGANDVIVAVRDMVETLIPFIEDVIIEVNLEMKEIIVKLQEWK